MIAPMSRPPRTGPLVTSIPQYVSAALKAGVKGYVLKSQVSSDLIHAIQQVLRGHVYLSPGISASVMAAYHSKSEIPTDPLTSRERQVLQLIAEGKSTKDVASLLGVSVKTAESHRLLRIAEWLM